jgi:ABC-type Fe3+-siderophore transport system permease subunit
MKLDVRLPIGMMFSLLGAMLVVYGLVSDRSMYARSLGINVNLWWGLVLLAFGSVMLTFALRSRRGQGDDARPAAPAK